MINIDVQLRLIAQRSLWGLVPSSLRAASVSYDAHIIAFRCIFDGPPSEDDWELLSIAATEIIADFDAPYTIDDQYLAIPYPQPMEHLRYLIYLRYELNKDHPIV